MSGLKAGYEVVLPCAGAAELGEAAVSGCVEHPAAMSPAAATAARVVNIRDGREELMGPP